MSHIPLRSDFQGPVIIGNGVLQTSIFPPVDPPIVITVTQNIASAMRSPGHEQGAFNLSNGTDTAHNSLKWTINESGKTLDNVAPLYVGWYLQGSGSPGEANNNGNLVVRSSIEYPIGTLTQVKFGGNTSGTVVPGGQLIADSTTVSIPAGARFGIRTYLTCAAGVKWNGDARVAYSSPGIDLAESGASGTLANKTMSGTIAESANIGYFPAAVLSTGTGFRKSYMVCGDSIVVGAGTAGWDDYQNRGGISRGFSNKSPIITAAVTGTTATDQINAVAGRLALAQAAGVTHSIVEYGSNDLTGFSVSQVQSDLTTLYGKFTSKNIKVIGWTIPPRLSTVAPDYNTTTTSQTPDTTGNFIAGSGSGRATFNTWIRSKPAGMFDYIEGADQFDANVSNVLTRDGGYWRVGPSTYLEGPVATTIQSGSTTTVINTNSSKFTDYWVFYAYGALKFTSGALNGTLAPIQTNNSTGQLTLQNPLPSVPAAGTTAVLLGIRGSSTIDGVHPIIPDAQNGFGADLFVRDAVAAKTAIW